MPGVGLNPTPAVGSVEGAWMRGRAPHSRVAQPQGYTAWSVCVCCSLFPTSPARQLDKLHICVFGGLVTQVIGARGLLRLHTACQAYAQTVPWWVACDFPRKSAAFHQANFCARAGRAVGGALCWACNPVHTHDMSSMEGPWADSRVPKAWSSGMCTQPVCVPPTPPSSPAADLFQYSTDSRADCCALRASWCVARDNQHSCLCCAFRGTAAASWGGAWQALQEGCCRLQLAVLSVASAPLQRHVVSSHGPCQRMMAST